MGSPPRMRQNRLLASVDVVVQDINQFQVHTKEAMVLCIHQGWCIHYLTTLTCRNCPG